MRCKRNTTDPLLQKLVLERGANLIVPPSTIFNPGVLVLRDLKGNTMRPSDWQEVFGVAIQIDLEDEGSRNFEGFRASNDMDVSTGGSILGDLLGLGENKNSVTAAIKASGASKVRFGLHRSSYTSLGNIDNVLTQLREAEAKPAETYTGRQTFIVTKSWWAEGVTMDLMQENKRHLDVSAEAIEQLKTSLRLQHKSLAAGDQCFFADGPKIFAVTMRELKFEGGLVRDVAQENYLINRDGDNDIDRVFSIVDDENIIFDVTT